MISQTLENFFYLLRCSIHRENVAEKLQADPAGLQRLKETDWEEFTRIAASTRTIPLLFASVSKCAEMVGADETLVGQWKQKTFERMLRELQKHSSICTLLQEAEKSGLKMVVLKGIVLSDLYPERFQRIAGDTDIWVREEDKDNATTLLEQLDYCRNEKSSKKHVQVYERQKPRHIVELHTKLSEDYTGKRIDIVDSIGLTNDESLIRVQACGVEVLTLGIDQHLIYQIFHIVKHFMLESVGIRYLIDIVLYIKKYEKQLDIGGFWEKMEHLGYTKFCRHLFSICIEYLGMSPAILAGGSIDASSDTQRLLSDILHLDALHSNKTAGWQILGAMTPYFTGEKEIKRSKIGRILDVIFLRPKDLTKEYSYAKKHVVLLPIAWIHRAYQYFTVWFSNRRYHYSINEKLDVAEHRLYLMSRLGLANEKR